MSDLPKRLEAAGERDAEKFGKGASDYAMKSHRYLHFMECHRSLHPLIHKMAEALEKGKFLSYHLRDTDRRVQKQAVFELELWYLDANEALKELEKYLGGV